MGARDRGVLASTEGGEGGGAVEATRAATDEKKTFLRERDAFPDAVAETRDAKNRSARGGRRQPLRIGWVRDRSIRARSRGGSDGVVRRRPVASAVVPAASGPGAFRLGDRGARTWMVGPSARGSEYGTPSSMTSAPASSRILSALAVAPRLGSPAQMKGTNAHCPRALRSANVSPMLAVSTASAAAAARRRRTARGARPGGAARGPERARAAERGRWRRAATRAGAEDAASADIEARWGGGGGGGRARTTGSRGGESRGRVWRARRTRRARTAPHPEHAGDERGSPRSKIRRGLILDETCAAHPVSKYCPGGSPPRAP